MFYQPTENPTRFTRPIGFLFLMVLVVFHVPCWLWALGNQTQREIEERRIEEIRIIGNRRIPESTILYYIQTRENDPYNEAQLLRDYRSLLNTNFFEDATLKVTQGEIGSIVMFEVQERPLIRAIEYEGMRTFKESDVLERFREMRVGLSVDSPFDPSKLPKARRALKMLLGENGKPLGRVETDIERITSSSIRLVFNLDEGPKVRIGDIRFEGNTVFPDDKLRASLEVTKERGLISIFKGHDKYIKDKVEYDLQVNLLQSYRANGYIFCKAGEPKVEIVEAPRGLLLMFRKTKQQYYITIPIEEGEQFKYGDFAVEGVTTLDADEVERFYNVTSGEVVNYVALKKANETLRKAYSRNGYLDVTVMPEVNPDVETKTVSLTVRVEEGKQYIVHRIKFAGNTKTLDKVLRREFFLEEQDRFNGDLLDMSVLRVNQLGFFEKIEEKDYEVVKRPDLSEVDIVVTVKERSQQSIGVTGGVSGLYGGFFGINYYTNNFRGMGQRIDLNVTTGSRYSNYMLGFTEPYFLDSEWSMGMRVFNQRYRFDTFTMFFGMISPSKNVQLYSQITSGFTLFSSHSVGRWARLGLDYSLQNIRIDDVAPIYQGFATNQLVGFTPGGNPEDSLKGIIRSEVTPRLTFNTKNQYYAATAGSKFTVESPISGGPLGGTFNVVKPYVEYQTFFTDRWLSRGRHTVAIRASFMHMIPFGKLPDGSAMSVPFFERIFMGSEFDLRGFDLRSVTPWGLSRTPTLDNRGNPLIDPATGLPAITDQIIPVGGDTRLLLTAEYRMPIVGPFQVVAFADVGTSTVLRKSNLVLFGPNSFIELLDNTNNILRASTGAEIQFNMPMINQPFRLIFSYNPLRLDTNVVLEGVRFPMAENKKNMRFSVGYTF